MNTMLDTAARSLVVLALLLLSVSWIEGSGDLLGPIPKKPVYDDANQWFIRNRHAEADLFYIISTETGDHLAGADTCHFADVYDAALRRRMEHEMFAVDSFYSGRLNYYSPYYRQVSMQSWTNEDNTLLRLPMALADVQRSWDYYLQHFNQGRPFILAGFSQGAHALMHLLRQMPDSVARRMVAAYVIGYKVTQEDLDACRHIRPAQGPTDTGEGIPEEKREDIFKAFLEIHDLTKGDGLGLPICKQMALKMNGDLNVDPAFTKGTRFVLELKS